MNKILCLLILALLFSVAATAAAYSYNNLLRETQEAYPEDLGLWTYCFSVSTVAAGIIAFLFTLVALSG